eukprot:TRINITY_DN25657_c0_g1_i1.p1 TRINITY_DN25657_c0_g1~~TRINITY_DN25657_c0_g1_i1.p1  ORF type:complete len:210 (-),score=61.76 TRINITY_DN25657_c0_g1_i1:265-894(-)
MAYCKIEDDEDVPTMYLNIMIMEKTEELDKMIKEKVAQKMPNPLGFGLLGRAAGKLAVKVVDEKKIAAKLAIKMPEVMPEKMSQMGITAEAEEVFRKGAFVVVRLKIKHLDVHAMMAAKLGEDKAAKVDKGMACLKCLARWFGYKDDAVDQKVDRTMGDKIVEAMCKSLPEALPKTMAEKGIIVEIAAKSEKEQAAYFFEAIKHYGLMD